MNKDKLSKIKKYLDRKNLDYEICSIQDSDINMHDNAFVLDWNRVPQSLYEVIESEFDTFYGDDCYHCANCYDLINNHPDGWGWQINAINSSDGYICMECADNDSLDYYTNEDNQALPSRFLKMVLDAGFKKYNDDVYESGLHTHMKDNPKKIVEALPDNVDFIFVLDDVSQFGIGYNLYTKPSDK